MQDHCSVTFTLDADEIEYDENIFLSLISSMHAWTGRNKILSFITWTFLEEIKNSFYVNKTLCSLKSLDEIVINWIFSVKPTISGQKINQQHKEWFHMTVINFQILNSMCSYFSWCFCWFICLLLSLIIIII